ncbi:MAG: addiction module protein [Chlamydiae bacterium]|nr:addiction module protein [Chlamydiota bacterium]
MLPARKLVQEALHLKPAERFIVIEALIKSLDIPDPVIEQAWAKEAEKRLKAYKDGKLETVSFEDMFGTNMT